ncbi:hypothetical protein [Fontibacter flavus]|uniref:Uncharacterized protein n=1 Tax=Fontibacter flavus TaxID=654838 RepID=A0ABV6FYI8_9BACT|nr:hypothetical protein [Cyclobacteriaceae bacterium]
MKTFQIKRALLELLKISAIRATRTSARGTADTLPVGFNPRINRHLTYLISPVGMDDIKLTD